MVCALWGVRNNRALGGLRWSIWMLGPCEVLGFSLGFGDEFLLSLFAWSYYP